MEHYATLDGLRGLAAVAIVLMHAGTWLGFGWMIPNSVLAVDFFFCLSGYVLCLAYHRKLGRSMTVSVFARVRLVRLMPVVVVATLIGASYVLLRHLVSHDPLPLGRLALFTLLGLFNLPWLGGGPTVNGSVVFQLNFPQYTLFFELVVNFVWALWRRADRLVPAVAIATTGFLLCAIWGMEGVDADHFWTGFPRVFAGFYAGVALFHAEARWPALAGTRPARLFLPLALLTLIFYLVPVVLPFAVRWLWCILVAPALVLSGAKVTPAPPVRRAALVLGALSYPLYALHWPVLVWVNGIYQLLLGRKDIGVFLVGVPAAIVASWLVLRLIDEPVRRRLTPAARVAPARG